MERKMSTIYDLNLKEMRKLFRKFNKTLYGRTIFLLAFLIPTVIFIASIVLTVFCWICHSASMINSVLIMVSVGVVLFILGNMYYYHELKEFLETKK